MTRLWDLDRLTQAQVMFGSVCADLHKEPWPRTIRTALSDWVVYPDDTIELIMGGDGASVPAHA